MLIWVASYPRSGNRLIRTALATGWGIDGPSVFDAAEAARAAGLSLPDPKHDPQIEQFRQAREPRFLKTHLVDHADSPDPGIFLVRDGRDSVVSYAHFIEARPGMARGRRFEQILMHLIERGGGQFGSWSEAVEAWIARGSPTAVVRFEALRQDPQGVARSAVAELGIDLGEPSGEMWSFEQMREADPSVVRRGHVGDWRSEMSEAAIARFAELHGPTLVKLGYEASADPAEWPLTGEQPSEPAAAPADSS